LAEKKTVKSGASSSKKKQSEKQMELSENARVKKRIKELKMQQDRENTICCQIMPGVLVFAALFIAVCFIIPDKMGFLQYIVKFFKGILAGAVWTVPFCLAIMGFYWKKDYVSGSVGKKIALCCFFASFFAGFIQLLDLASERAVHDFNPVNLYLDGIEGTSGGVIGGLLGNLLDKFTGIGAYIICFFMIVLFGFSLFNITPADMFVFCKNKIKESVYNANLERERRLEESINQQNKDKQEIISKAKEKSAEEEAQDAKNMRKRRAYLEDAGLDGADEKDEALPEEEIKPELDREESSPSYGEPEVMVNLDAFNLAKEENEQKFSGETVDTETGEVYEIPPLPDIPLDTEFVKPASSSQHEEMDMSDIFTSDASVSMGGKEAGAGVMSGEDGADLSDRTAEGSEAIEAHSDTVAVVPEPKIEEVYNFPPINFLQQDPNPLTFAVTDELKQTSVKLVETLKNFGVKTKIMNICCGPTVTRYELQPEVGVRVRSIANLSDDIALHLAAAGVRIEAPIPGKDAVGIEIPNKTVSTVYLRNLIESDGFVKQKSKITVCLGMDVAGSPVYMNIAKMPHMLIAGATGMGKSVCINSFIVSVLYKARPDEVKLMLIDPKKVELSIYNGLPHLLVPVVSDPKKAAGSLAWAVNEMERRFQLIEEVGVRDSDTYNEVTKEDPEKEYMPKIVIIIDELADLMMTARDEVETSICRLAQKARAAGMHLVIGTQRPSVDVITGLIKANVPSRIAFTVASQVDSRTIIDVSGAEKLLGRGDMLYAPVGSMKPMRVQGSFVSEKEIENIVEFLKNGKKFEYDADIIASIEREAARCGEKKKGKGGDSDGGYEDGEDRDSIISSDDAVLPAIEIAVDSGSVSTSLLQRKLSLGYARAARIVDKLEKIGVVGPFEGSKPRKVLITREEYLEMRMNYEGGEE